MHILKFADVKVGKYVIVNDNPCKIIDVKTSAPGKHGSVKKRITVISLITGKKCEDILTHHSIIQTPLLTKTVYTLVDIDDEILVVTDNNGIFQHIPLFEKQLEKFNNINLTQNEVSITLIKIQYEVNDEEISKIVFYDINNVSQG